jgi:PAS domain S-box-containing protein
LIFLNFNKVKTNEQKLKESEEKFRTISEQSLMGITILQDDRYKYVNQAAADMLGYTVEELLDTPQGGFMNYIHPEDREFVREQATKKQMGMKDVITKYPYRGLTKSGETIWVQNYSCTITYEGKYADLITMIDFTERKKAQKSLKESEEKYRYYFNHAQVGLFWSRISDGKFIECNDTFAKLVGYDTREECLADYIALEHYVDLNLRDEMLEEILINNEIKDYEIQVTKRDGTPFWASISARTDLKENRIEGAAIDITARKKVEQKLKESEVKYRHLFETSPYFIGLLNTEGIFIDCNKAINDILSIHTVEDLKGKNFKKIFLLNEKNKYLIPIFEKAVKSIFEGVNQEGFDFRLNRAIGGHLWIHIEGTLIEIEKQKLIQFIMQDITERKKAEEALKESEARFKGIFESKDITDANDVYLEMVGYSKDEILSGTIRWRDLTPPEYTDLDNKALEEIATTGVMTPIEKEYIRKNGSRFPILVGGSALPGSTLGGVSFILDITERKKAEQKLKDSEQKFRTISEQSLAGILILQDYEVKYANQKGADLLGTSIDEMKAWQVKDFLKCIHPEDLNIILKPLKKREKGFNSFLDQVEYRIIRKNGQVIWLNSYSKIFTFDGKPADLVISIDITDRKKAEQKLKETIEDLARINAELEQFTYIASHDLKEPLRMISSFAHLLEKRYKDKLDEDANDFISFITEGVLRMQDLINNLLDYSKIGKLHREFERVDLNDVLKDVIDNLRQLINETNAEIINDSLPSIYGDKYQLLQVFQNLISNAIKFRGIDSPLISISANPDGKHWVFSISDNGIGIDSKDLERIFIIFKRLHTTGKYEGTGIGLAICKKIVEYHRGKIWVESELGKGSTFYFSIPKEIDIKR